MKRPTAVAVLWFVAALFGALEGRAEGAAVSWDGELRFRYEYRSPLDYRLPGTAGRPADHGLGDAGDVGLLRTRLGSRMTLERGVRAYLQLQDSRVFGAGGSPLASLGNVDLHQGYVEAESLAGLPLSLRVGRQELRYGDQRLVSPLDWSNVGRAWDALRARVEPAGWSFDAFVAWIAEGRRAGDDRLFAGGYASWHPVPDLEADAYLFWRSFGDTGFVSESGRRGSLDDRTIGGRLRGAASVFEARAETAWQRGERAGDRVRAWAAAVRVIAGRFPRGRVRGIVEYLHASGDGDPGDGRAGRFDPLYPFGHFYLGALDIVGWSNVRDLSGTVTARPHPGWTVQVELHRFRLDEARDAWVDAAGTPLRRDPTGAAGRDLGYELDGLVRRELGPGLVVSVGYSHLWAGRYIERTGEGGDADWGFVQLSASF